MSSLACKYFCINLKILVIFTEEIIVGLAFSRLLIDLLTSYDWLDVKIGLLCMM